LITISFVIIADENNKKTDTGNKIMIYKYQDIDSDYCATARRRGLKVRGSLKVGLVTKVNNENKVFEIPVYDTMKRK
jgi:hypothetical protein